MVKNKIGRILICMFLLISAVQTFKLFNRSSFKKQQRPKLVEVSAAAVISAKCPMREVSMTISKASTKPWDLLKAVSDIIGPAFQQNECLDANIEQLLAEQGFAHKDIEEALDWIERVAMSGSLADVISMLQDKQENMRVANPLEIAYLSQSLWKRIEACRMKGILSNDLYEKLLEDIRVIDTRDWEEEEVKIFLAELLNAIIPHTAHKDFMRILDGNFPEYYS